LVFAGTSFVCLIFIYTMYTNYRHNQQLVSLAYHDTLTGLPNNEYLSEVLAERLERVDTGNSAVMLVHLRNLSEINSVYGFAAGDRVMHSMAERLAELVRPDRRLFRFSSNRFVFLLEGYGSREELADFAERIRHHLEEGQDPLGHHLAVGVGIVELSGSHQGPEEVLTQAAIVVQHLQNTQSPSSYAFFDVEMAARLRREEIITQELRRFVASPILGTVYLHYQPKVELATGRVVGFEALARMNSPSLGMVSPAEFIPIAERHNLIVPLGYLVLERACGFILRLNYRGFTDLHVGVNISPLQLLQEDFVQRVGEILRDTGIEPHRLQLEITESVLIEDFAGIAVKLHPLRELGVTIALDDFGTGCSALSRIGELPIDCIKIDKGFIDNMIFKAKHRLIIKDLISMCHKLGLRVVAEGVEQETQRRDLLESGCDVMQGYLYSKLLLEEEALAKLA
jgi:diguanylate cyclase (GGDEF)-like protein